MIVVVAVVVPGGVVDADDADDEEEEEDEQKDESMGQSMQNGDRACHYCSNWLQNSVDDKQRLL